MLKRKKPAIPLQRTSKIARHPKAVHGHKNEELVLINSDDMVFCNINAMGSALWFLLEDKVLSFEALCQQVQDHYQVTTAQCLEDVGRFVEDMVRLNFLTIENDS